MTSYYAKNRYRLCVMAERAKHDYYGNHITADARIGMRSRFYRAGFPTPTTAEC